MRLSHVALVAGFAFGAAVALHGIGGIERVEAAKNSCKANCRPAFSTCKERVKAEFNLAKADATDKKAKKKIKKQKKKALKKCKKDDKCRAKLCNKAAKADNDSCIEGTATAVTSPADSFMSCDRVTFGSLF